MRYLLDSDTLIRAKNDSYPFDSCPGFWTWIEKLNEQGIVFSIDKIKQELIEEGDQLSNWAKMRGAEFFLKSDGADTQKALRDVVAWVHLHQRYSDAAKHKFLSVADFRLVGHAIATQSTIVTFEKDEPDAKESIKIPSACRQFNVACINLWGLIRAFKSHPLRLILNSN